MLFSGRFPSVNVMVPSPAFVLYIRFGGMSSCVRTMVSRDCAQSISSSGTLSGIPSFRVVTTCASATGTPSPVDRSHTS